MNLQQIKTFVRVAEAGSFSKAAVLLDVAQPALSRQVRALELELRETLLIRTGRGVQAHRCRAAAAGARPRHPATGGAGQGRPGRPARRAGGPHHRGPAAEHGAVP